MPDSNVLARKSVQGVFALASRTLVLSLISFVASLVIFTILTPTDIGIYTAIIAIQRVISFFTDFGFGAALVQKKEELTAHDTTTSFTLQLVITGAMFLIVLAAQPVISGVFKFNSAAMFLLLALVFSIFLSSFKTIPSIILERKIHFHRLVLPQIIESLTFNVVLLVLVLQHVGLASFAYAFLISSVASIPFYYYVSPWEIKLGIHRKSLGYLKFGLQFQAKNVLATIKDDLLTVILTRLLTFAEIGYIGFAQRLSFFFYRYVVDSVTRVTFTSYSRIQDEKKLLGEALEKSLFYVAAIMFPSLAILIILGGHLIQFIPKWQMKWEPATISIVFFSLNAMVSSMSGILVNVLDATGKVKVTLRLMMIWTVLTWTLTPILIKMLGYNGVAIASFLVTLTIVYTVVLVRRSVPFSFYRSIMKPASATLIMSILLFTMNQFFATNLLLLIMAAAIGGIVYLGLFWFIARSELKEAKVFLRKS